jgi:hypothetical protein
VAKNSPRNPVWAANWGARRSPGQDSAAADTAATSSKRGGAEAVRQRPSCSKIPNVHHQNEIVGVPIGQEVHAGREQQRQQSAALTTKKIPNTHEQRSERRKDIAFTAKQVGVAGSVGKGSASGLGVYILVEISGGVSEWRVWARFIRVEKITPVTDWLVGTSADLTR